MDLRQFRFSVENFIALAVVEVKLGQTWSQHGPDMVPKNMVPKNRHSTEMVFRPYIFSVKNFSTLAGLEVKLGQIWSLHGPYMALIWS